MSKEGAYSAINSANARRVNWTSRVRQRKLDIFNLPGTDISPCSRKNSTVRMTVSEIEGSMLHKPSA